MNSDIKYWVALSTHPKIGARTLLKLYKRYKAMSRVWSVGKRDLLNSGLDLNQADAVGEVVTKKDPEKELAKLAKFGVSVLIYPDKKYPSILKEIPDPPGILYYRGQPLGEDEICVAVVGSRKYSSYGKQVTEELVYPLAKNKIVVVSGLALGIDAIAHNVTLEAKGRTIAVLGCGLDQIYPVANVRIADKIISSGGTIISEFPLGTPALRYNFPIRNRIIAGLSLGTVVVECAESSGSLLTASAAIGYNRIVFAVPGNIFSENSAGPNRLIKMGATPITGYKDILEDLNISEKQKASEVRELIPDSKEEETLLKLLKEPVLLDYLVEKSGMDTAKVNSLLILLEMKGMVKNLGGTRYSISQGVKLTSG